ncbi:MAG: AMP-binding protein [Hyphomicrobiales bacterium]|nr:AMP-binding protein [Hyphomicrobiales bacterium]
MTLFALFARIAGELGTKPAIRQRNTAVSYAQLYNRVIGAATRIEAQLDRPGGIAIALRDRVELLIAFLACAAIGRPAAPIDPDLPKARLDLILSRHFATVIREPVFPTGYSAPAIAHHPDAEFYWGLTSGSTGEPKLVARSHASWIASFEAAEQVFDFHADDTILVPGPLHHSLFLYGAIHGLCRGNCVALPPGPFRVDRLSAYQASHLYVIPFMLGKMIAGQTPIPGLRQVFCGGAKLEPTLSQSAKTLWPDIDLVEFYGATETSFVSFHSTKRPANSGSVGRIFPGVRIEIRDTEGKPVNGSGSGEIFVASDMLFERYVGGLQAEKWVSAGDVGWLDGDNCLYLTGRKNRVINSKGLKIHPEQIEAALTAREEIEAAAVIGVPDLIRGSAAVAVIAFKPGRQTERAALSAFCRAEFGEGYSPLRYYQSDRLPTTSSGKLAFSAIAEGLDRGDPSYRELT